MKLKKIDLRKCVPARKEDSESGWTHPDISLRKWYLVKNAGQFAAGQFEREWYGLNFNGFYDAGLQFDKPGHNGSDIQGVWEIVR